MSSDQKTREQKLERALHLVQKSGGLKTLPLKLNSNQWAGVLKDMDEKTMDDLLLILEEEHELRTLAESTAARKHQVNDTRLLHRLEKLKLSLEQVSSNPDDHVE